MSDVFRDAFEDERVNPVARPRVIIFQTLVNDERQLKLVRLLDRESERMIEFRAFEHLHPVQHIFAVRIDGFIVQKLNSLADLLHI